MGVVKQIGIKIVLLFLKRHDQYKKILIQSC